ncbi:MAG: glycoside hydrolase family 9 protein [Bacteroidales bacterium]|nr:glycoside hydrolase family 9 protein [Bacteroidales bacterium]
MKNIFFLLTALVVLSAGSCNNQKQEIMNAAISESIRINQVGYYPDGPKRFMVADQVASDFHIVDEKGETFYKGNLENFGTWDPSGEKLFAGDFSDFRKQGEYSIYIPDVGKSHPFSIANDLYEKAATASLRTFYFMRTAMEMEEKYLGKFARPMGHPDDTVYFHPSSGRTEGFVSSPGGWYDAGDYGKYVVNAAIATGTMLSLHEIYPGVFEDGSLNIPESGNNISDLLDEVKYELDWVLTMQDQDGGVFHKLTPLRHDGITMPHETHSKRYIIGKSTGASLDFAAMMAQAARLFDAVDPVFSKKCLAAATIAHEWAMEHPEQYFRNPRGINTGGYGDRILKEEFFWAAAELYCTTGDQRYYEIIQPELGKITFRLEESWRNYMDNIGYYSLLSCGRLNDDDKAKVINALLELADNQMNAAYNNGYDVPFSRFVWGSNSDVLNNAMIQLYAHHVSGEKKYLDAAAAMTDYIFGKNATGYSFVSGYGTKYSKNFHHRLLMADENEETFPGYVAGGPNFYRQDSYNLQNQNVSYPDTLPAKTYIDHEGSYASNEICINWNAPLVFVLGYLDAQFND